MNNLSFDLDDSLSPIRRQAITGTNHDLWIIEPLLEDFFGIDLLTFS